jgi:hypothetical protein
MAEEEVGYYVLMEKGKDTEHVFSGKQPRRAALKAATRGFKDIKLRERGVRRDGKSKVHVFKGSVVEVDAPANRPAWLPAKVKKPKVTKVGIEWVKV